jgi:hypothetical protein
MGCDELGLSKWQKKYETVESDGKLYLIDKTNGRVFTIEGTRFVEVARADDAVLVAASTIKYWEASPVEGLKFEIATKYKNGNMLYRIGISGQYEAYGTAPQDKQRTLSAAPGRGLSDEEVGGIPELINPQWFEFWENQSNGIYINMMDQDGFLITMIPLTLSGIGRTDRTNVIDDEGKTIEFRYDGKLTIDLTDYESIRYAHVTYVLEKPERKQK